MSDNSGSTACTNFSYGEVEDYTINIVASKTELPALAEDKSEGSQLSNEIHSYFTLYPNPATDVLNITLLNNQIANVTIYNILGVKVIDVILNDTNSEINISELSSGSYIVIMNDGQKEFTTKFIKR